jgi:hypothetical protein
MYMANQKMKVHFIELFSSKISYWLWVLSHVICPMQPPINSYQPLTFRANVGPQPNTFLIPLNNA